MDEVNRWRSLGLDLPGDLQRYQGLQEPDWDCPIGPWYRAMSGVSVDTLMGAEQCARVLRAFAVLDPESRWRDQAEAEADRIMRYIDIRTAFLEAAEFVGALDTPTRSRLAEDVRAALGEVDDATLVIELISLMAQSFLEEARATWINVAVRLGGGAENDWFRQPPELRRTVIGDVRKQTSIAPTP